jgi:GNAT superfamily N-acetyltransferase
VIDEGSYRDINEARAAIGAFLESACLLKCLQSPSPALGTGVSIARIGENHRMADETVIRDIAPTDFNRWLQLWEGYNVFYQRVGPAAISVEITSMTWARFFDSYEPVNALVAERHEQLLGFAHYIFHRNTTMLGPTCYLQGLFTSELARGQGIGRALINGVYDRARAAGSKRVYWQTRDTNVTAQKLYDKVAERSGFIVYRKNL